MDPESHDPPALRDDAVDRMPLWPPVLAFVAVLLATQIRWVARHGMWPTVPMRFSLALAIGTALGLAAWLGLRAAFRHGWLSRSTMEATRALLVAAVVLAPGAWFDPTFPGLTVAAMLLVAAWGVDREGGPLRTWVSGLTSPAPAPPGIITGIAIILGAAAAVGLRAPELLSTPRLWAEDGTHTLAAMWNLGGLEALLWHHEYYRLFSNIAGWLATRVFELEQAPLVFSLVAWAVKMIVFLIVVTGRSPLWDTSAKKLATVAVILFTPHSDEIWLNVNGSHFYLSLLAALLLVEIDQPASVLRRWTLRVLLAATALGGVLPCLLAPLFWLRALHTRRRELFIAAGIVTTATAVQGLAALASTAEMERGSAATSTMAGWIILIKHGALLVDDGLARAAFRASRAVFEDTGIPTSGQWLLAAQLTIVALLAWRLRTSPAIYLLGAAVVLTLFTLLYGIGGMDQGVFRHPYLGSRYFYAPSVLLVLATLAAITVHPRIASVVPSAAVALLVVGLVVGNGYRSGLERSPWIDDFPLWHDELARWRADPGYHPTVWPPAFRIDMDAVPR